MKTRPITKNSSFSQILNPVERQTYTIEEAAKIGICRAVACRKGVLPTERQPTQLELEQQESWRQAERRAARLGISPIKTNGTAADSPFPSGETIDTGIVAAVPAEQPQAGHRAVRAADTPPGKQPEPNGQAKQSDPSLPKFDHATALKFYNAVRQSAFILGFTQGRHVTSAEEFPALTKEADNKHEHLFFHAATVRPTWTSGTTATKDQILECPYLWGDCDAEKYAGNDPVEAVKHYETEGSRVRTAIDNGLLALGIAPFAIWRSGAGWQFLIKLDQAIEPDEAEILVGKLHVALGFDPVVRNCNRILRVPGSVNWKDGKDGRVPSPCTPLILIDKVPS